MSKQTEQFERIHSYKERFNISYAKAIALDLKSNQKCTILFNPNIFSPSLNRAQNSNLGYLSDRMEVFTKDRWEEIEQKIIATGIASLPNICELAEGIISDNKQNPILKKDLAIVYQSFAQASQIVYIQNRFHFPYNEENASLFEDPKIALIAHQAVFEVIYSKELAAKEYYFPYLGCLVRDEQVESVVGYRLPKSHPMNHARVKKQRNFFPF